MTWMPAALALASIEAPLVASIESSRITFTPSPTIASAICDALAVLPPAFWMSLLMPASSNAFFSRGASYNVYRVDEVVSGRITPISTPSFPPLDPPSSSSEPHPVDNMRITTPMATAANAFLRTVSPSLRGRGPHKAVGSYPPTFGSPLGGRYGRAAPRV